MLPEHSGINCLVCVEFPNTKNAELYQIVKTTTIHGSSGVHNDDCMKQANARMVFQNTSTKRQTVIFLVIQLPVARIRAATPQ